MKNSPSTQDRIWAVTAHLSALAMGMGILLPVVGWSENRRKSKCATFQCLQALGYQSLGYTVWVLSALVILMIAGISAAVRAVNVESLEGEMYSIVIAHTALMFGLVGIYFVLPVIAAIACALGRDFRYPLMGNRLAKYLRYDALGSEEWLIEEHEDRWVASMGHFAVIIILWGMMAPVTAWILQGKRSSFLKFQSAQALVFQAGALLLLIVSGCLYFGAAFFFIFSVGLSGEPSITSPTGMAGLIVFLFSMLCTLVIVLTVPLLHIMGQWAGYRVLKGDDYRYPIVGRWVEKWLMRR